MIDVVWFTASKICAFTCPPEEASTVVTLVDVVESDVSWVPASAELSSDVGSVVSLSLMFSP